MTGLNSWDSEDFKVPGPRGLEPHQLKAAAQPRMSLRELASEAPAPQSSGNFKDLESLLEQLGAPPVFELGNPLPQEKFLLKMQVGSCPAAHNRALLGEAD